MAEVTRVTQAGFSMLAQGEPGVRVTQAGFQVVAGLATPSVELLRVGADTPSNVYLGADEVSKVYLGANLVWGAT